MYFYFFDKCALEKRHDTLRNTIETRLTDLGIHGRTERISIFKNMRELLENGIKQGAHTVIVVGDDHTFAQAVNIVAPHQVALGFIPIVSHSQFARVLGIDCGEDACTVISQRLYKTVDVGRVGSSFFLGALVPTDRQQQLIVRCDHLFSIQSLHAENGIEILNLGNIVENDPVHFSSAHDGKLEVRVVPPNMTHFFPLKKAVKEKQSVFLAQHI